jgi:GAF domain-containing protein
MALVTRLATSLECDRVSLGFMRAKRVRVSAMSHSADFGKQTNLVRAIAAAMDEAIDQQITIVYPVPPDAIPFVTRVHAELDRQHGSGAICTFPLEVKGRCLGALMLERPTDRPFDPETVELCETVAALTGPILDTKRAEQRWLIRKAVESFARQLGRLNPLPASWEDSSAPAT